MNFFKVMVTICLFAIMLLSSPTRSQQQSADSSSVFGPDAGQKRIDLDILNMDVESVLKIISDTSGWTIIPSQKVRGKVSLWSKSATARQLLDKLSLVNNYVYRQEENVIYLMTKDEYEELFGRATKTFCLKHQRAENIKPLLENSLTKTGKLGIDSWSNTIVVNDTAENLKKVESLVARLDQGFVQKRFQLVNARAAEAAEILNKICSKEGPFQAETRSNSIVVFNSQSNVERIAGLIAQLDQDVVTRVFQIRFQQASELARQISDFFRSGSGGTGGEAGKAGLSSQVIVSDATNQIIFTGSASQVSYIAGLIEELDSKVVTTTIPLKRLKASQVVTQISHLASKPENITADSQGNRLIIRDNTHNIEQIRKVIQELDEVLVTRVFSLEYAIAEDIENALRPFVTNPETLRVEPRTNQIIVCDNTSQVARLENLIKKLDCEDAYFTRTYHLKHASASHVAGMIEALIPRRSLYRTYEGTIERKEAVPGYEPGERAPIQSDRITTGTGPGPPRPRKGAGSAPGLAAAQSLRKEAAAPSTTKPPATPGPQAVPVPEAPQTDVESLGTAGTVVADDRSNTVTITETLAILTKIEQLIKDLDVPVYSYNYTVKYRQLDSLELDTKLENFLREEEDSFSIDSQTHSVHFTTIPSIAERVLENLEKWDKPAKQALIRARILTVSTTTLKDMGINFESFFDIDGVDVILEGSLPSQVGADHAGSLTVRKLTTTEYEAILRAIESDSQSQILANPRILVLDGKQAEVRMATDEPFTETSIDSDSGRIIENIRFLQVGTILQVQPSIKEDDTIEMDIALDVSSLIEIRNGVPVVNRNIATSNVSVKNNHVLMIGGLRFKRDINVVEKIPVLGDVPLAGGLFRSNRKELADTELVLFLQPSIVAASQGKEEALPNDDYGASEQLMWDAATDEGYYR